MGPEVPQIIQFEQILLETCGSGPGARRSDLAGRVAKHTGQGKALTGNEARSCARGPWRHLPNVLQWVTLVDHDPTRGAGVVLFQVLDQATPTDCLRKHMHVRK